MQGCNIAKAMASELSGRSLVGATSYSSDEVFWTTLNP